MCSAFRHHSVHPPGVGISKRVLLHCAIGLLTVTAGSRLKSAELFSFQASVGGWHLGTLAVGNIDQDAAPEIIVPYRDTSARWFLDAFKLNGSRVSGFPYGGGGEEINVSPTLYDLDGDGRAEILFTHGTRVIALKGNGSVYWSNTVNRLNYVPDSGYMTVPGGFYWSNGGGHLDHLPASAVFSSQVSSPLVADINGDGVREVITAWKIDPDSTSGDQDFNPFINDVWGFAEWGTVGETWSGGVVFMNAANGSTDYIYHIHQLVESGLALGRADADRPLETYVLNDSDSVVCFDKTKAHGFYGNGTLHKQFGKNQRLMSGSYQVGVDVYTADIDGDGLAEVLVPTTRRNPLWEPNDTILDDDGAILWRAWTKPVHFTLNQWQNNACMIPVNPDQDNHVDVLTFAHSHEISFRYWNGAELINRPGWPKTFSPQLPTPPVMGDVDGDGQEEIVVGTYDPEKNPSEGALYVFELDGAVRNIVPVPGGIKHIPSLVDVNNDGGLEVVYRSLAGRVYAQNFGATQAGPASWTTHRGNVSRDGNYSASLFPPGTPLVTQKQGGYQRARFVWENASGYTALGWRIYRADRGEGPFQHIASVAAPARAFTDLGLENGTQYFYEVAAVYEANSVRSAPFVITCGLQGNLIANGGFEENDHSHWDKWFTGEIEWTNMVGAFNPVHGGRKSMEITLLNKGNNGSISQYGQYGTPDAYIPLTNTGLYSFGGFLKSDGISQPSEHWLEWASTPTGENPTARPARPWPYYFTPQLRLGTNAGEWTYLNRTFTMPEGFPNVEIGHRYTIAAPGSGRFYLDDLFFRLLPSPSSALWMELLGFGSGWRYRADPPPANWFTTAFNDSNWPLGYAKFGAGGGPVNVITPLPPGRPAYYFRRTLVVPEVSCQDLLLSATCTEGGLKSLEIYLNGLPIATSGIEAVSGPGNRIEYFDLTPFAERLRAGTNTIAVILNNVSQPTWDDVAFDLRLQAIPSPPGVSTSLAIEPDFDSHGKLQAVNLSVRVQPDTIWRVESADSLAAPDWQLFERITGDASGELSLRDNTPGSRVEAGRFYRLVPD
jgi:hypothetical protein